MTHMNNDPASRIASALAIAALQERGFTGKKLGCLLGAKQFFEDDDVDQSMVSITLEVDAPDAELSEEVNDLMTGEDGAPLVLWALNMTQSGPYFA